MLDNVKKFLSNSRDSVVVHNQLMEFYDFKDNIMHKQNFEEIITEIYHWFRDVFLIDDMKITTYDIEKSKENTLYKIKDDFNINDQLLVIKYDFSKSYEVNGRLFLKFINLENKEKIQKDKLFLDFVFYELKSVLRNYLMLKKLNEFSYLDELTKLPNRKFLVKHLEAMFSVVKKEHLELAFLKIDIDRFKAVIDEFDFNIGNKVLKLLSDTLLANKSETDLVVKFDDSSFMLCMQDVQDEQEIEKLAQNIIDDFASKNVLVDSNTGQKLQKTVCIGIALHPQDGHELVELFKKADIALEEAKNKSRSSYKFYLNPEENNTIDFF